MYPTSLVEPEWLRVLSQRQPKAAELLARIPEEQQRLGYLHTFREICQQPATWLQTSELMISQSASLRSTMADIRSQYQVTDFRLSFEHQRQCTRTFRTVAGSSQGNHQSRPAGAQRPGSVD